MGEVVTCMLRPFYSRDRFWCPLDRSQGGMQWREKKSHHFSCWELNPDRPSCSLVTILTELPWYSVIWKQRKCFINGLCLFFNTLHNPKLGNIQKHFHLLHILTKISLNIIPRCHFLRVKADGAWNLSILTHCIAWFLNVATLRAFNERFLGRRRV
jgi:hypothetical protein